MQINITFQASIQSIVTMFFFANPNTHNENPNEKDSHQNKKHRMCYQSLHKKNVCKVGKNTLYVDHINKEKQGVCHIVTLSFTLKHMLRQKKNDENSNISRSKNIILKKIL
jgi:hypothetical protein